MEFKNVIRRMMWLVCILVSLFYLSSSIFASDGDAFEMISEEIRAIDLNPERTSKEISNKKKKTLIISTEQLDLTQLRNLNIENSAISLMSAKTSRGTGSSFESQYMTIASGIRVNVDAENFTGVHQEKDGFDMEAINFFNVLYQLNQDYDGFIDKFKFLGEIFHENGLKTAYIGDDSSIFLAADKEGKVDYAVPGVPYEYKELKSTIDDLSSKAQLTVLSYNIDDNYERLANIEKIVDDFDGMVFILPKMISGDVAVKNNKTIKPMLVKGLGNGVLNSNTTKRYGLVSNLDIMPTILDNYGIEYEGQVGKKLETIEGDKTRVENVDDVEFIFSKYMNLTSVKYSFNAMIIYLQVFLIILYLITGKSYRIFKYVLYVPIFSIMLSIIFGNKLAEFDRNIYIYSIMGVALLLSIVTHIMYLKYATVRKGIRSENVMIEKISILVFAMIVIGIVFLPENIYSSFVGYNNLVSGGRFFGFNNDVMGTLIGTFIMAYFYIRRDKIKLTRHMITLIGVGLLLISLSGRFGSNFGGLVTASVLSLMLIYGDIIVNASKKMKLVWGILAILGLFAGIFLMTRGGGNHISEFAKRVQLYGMEELFQMVSRKFYQVIVNTRRMPWIIAVVMQLMFMLRRIYIGNEQKSKDLTVLFLVISIIALLTNDTGVVALVYMNTILITSTLLKLNNNRL